MRLVRNPNWTWKTDLAWLFLHLPRAMLWFLWYALRRWRKGGVLSLRGAFNVALGLADAWAGRWYRVEV